MSITNDLSKLANSANVLVNSITVNSTAIVSEVIAGTLTTGNVTINGYVYANNGLLSNTSYTGPYADGIVMDYVTGNGRVSVGVGDTLSFYTNNVAGNLMFSANSTALSVNGTTVSLFGESNPNNFASGTYATNAALNTVIVGPYTIATGNTFTVTTGSRVVII